jgi:hypothetical protein
MRTHHPRNGEEFASLCPPQVTETGFLDRSVDESTFTTSNTNSNDEESLYINGVTVSSMSKYKITIPLTRCSNLKTVEAKALIDSGAEGKFVDSSLVDWKNVHRLKKNIPVQNVDGTQNKAGDVRYKTKICYNINKKQFEDWFYVMKLGEQRLILGLPWLQRTNPSIDWSTGTVSFPEESKINDEMEETSLEDNETGMFICTILKEEELDADDSEDLETDHLWIQAKTSASQALAHKHEENVKVELPPEYAKWRTVFDKQTSEQFPISCQWDHAIDLKEGFKPKVTKNYPDEVGIPLHHRRVQRSSAAYIELSKEPTY